MKVLLFDTTQSYLTPGGKQVHAQKLYENLPKVGVEVEYAQWWNPNQQFDVMHFFGYNAPYLIDALRKKHKKTVLTQIMDAQTNFSTRKKKLYSLGFDLLKLMPARVQSKFYTTYLNQYDALVYMHKFDKATAVDLFEVQESKTFVIPHASDTLKANDRIYNEIALPEKYLVSVGSITERKRSVLLAQTAKEARVPLVFIGPGVDADPYFKQFLSMVDNAYVFYPGFVDQQKKIDILAKASGFALLSTAESGCIAVFEAASLGLPLFLPDLLWAKCYQEPREIIFSKCDDVRQTAKDLSTFYQKAERKRYPSFKVHTWEEIAGMYKKVYETVLTGKSK
jgi:glycosyltransferase involved in cell wall biosynthesis